MAFALIITPGLTTPYGEPTPGVMKMYSAYAARARLALKGLPSLVLEQGNLCLLDELSLPADVTALVVDATLMSDTPVLRQNLNLLVARYPKAARVWYGFGLPVAAVELGFGPASADPRFSRWLDPLTFHETAGIYADALTPGESVAYALYQGCRFKCPFCNVTTKGAPGIGWHEGVVNKDFEQFAAAGVAGLQMIDAALTDYADKFDMFVAAKQKWLPTAGLSCQVRADVLKESHIDQLLSAGLMHLTAGIETDSAAGTRFYGKSGPRALEWMRALRNRAGGSVLTAGTFIIGRPGESIDDARRFVDWLTSPEGLRLVDLPWLNVLQVTTPKMAAEFGCTPPDSPWWVLPIPQHDAFTVVAEEFWARMEALRPGYRRFVAFSILPVCNATGVHPAEAPEIIRRWDLAFCSPEAIRD